MFYRLNDNMLTDLPPGQQQAPEAQRRQAVKILDQLSTGRIDGLCHGDVTPSNIIADEEGRLWLIDPRGMSGEVSYDVATLALKLAAHERHEANKIAVLLGKKLGLDADRIQAWIRVASAARV
ncbi:hypothetical protein GCM10012275_49010 [Longimycelium tulufanense]|uniref:Uncharacterized protein n=1 Tax=Longimycelium tulufanense TaxID=907463 RepID=A0A8J3FY17_9PSEU|nr:hypothetical protein GCM10012275_49010 [Longimycelium tulufanense]